MEWDIVETMTKSDTETFQLGTLLATLLKTGDVIALYGNLGSGKTVFAKGICVGLGVKGHVTSPSFTLIQEYHARLPVTHIDFYRLDSRAEIEDLGLDYYFENGVSLIEWAERGEVFIPAKHFSIYFDRIMEDHRIAEFYRKIKISGPRGRGLRELPI